MAKGPGLGEGGLLPGRKGLSAAKPGQGCQVVGQARALPGWAKGPLVGLCQQPFFSPEKG